MNKILFIILPILMFSCNVDSYSQNNHIEVEAELLEFIAPKMCGVISQEEGTKRESFMLKVQADTTGIYLSAFKKIIEGWLSDSLAIEWNRNFKTDKIYKEYIDLNDLTKKQRSLINEIHSEELYSVVGLLALVNTDDSNSLLAAQLLRFDNLFGNLKYKKYPYRTIKSIFGAFLNNLSKVQYYDERLVTLCYERISDIKEGYWYAHYLKYLEANMEEYPEIRGRTKNILKKQEYISDPHSYSIPFQHYFKQN